jgi:hypothetical protein
VIRIAALIAAMLASSAASAGDDELRLVPAAALIGKAYSGAGEASEIQFVNARTRPVRLNWIAFDGTARLYAVLQPGEELLQPTFVSHRWLITLAGGAPVEAFISTRADIHGDGQPQIAIIR